MTRIVNYVVVKCDGCGDDFEMDPWWRDHLGSWLCDNCLEIHQEAMDRSRYGD